MRNKIFCLACIQGDSYHKGHFEGCPHGRKKGGYAESELAGQRNAAARFLRGHEHKGTLSEIQGLKWYDNLVALASSARDTSGLGPPCRNCKRTTTKREATKGGPNSRRPYWKCMPCGKFASWAAPPPAEAVRLAAERADEEALAEFEALEAQAAQALPVDLTGGDEIIDLSQG